MLNQLGAADIRAYIDARKEAGAAPGTVKRELALLSTALNYARTELEWGIPNLVQGRKIKTPEGRVRWLSHDEADTLVRAAEMEPRAPHLPHFIRLALHTGMRKGELLGLDWRRIDLKAGLIHLDSGHTKTGKRRAVPVNDEARAALLSRLRFRAEHCSASPWVFCDKDGSRLANVRKGFESACRRGGIEDFHIHDLRHTCAAWLVSEGAQLAAVRDLLGHSSVTMTEKYAHLAPDNVRAAVRLLDGRSRSGHDKTKRA